MSGDEYLKYFYKGYGFKKDHFKSLADRYLLQAEVIVPLNQSTGKVILLKVMGFSPRDLIDICSCICALDEMKDLFGSLNGQYGRGISNKDWYSLKPKFLYHDSKYNPLTGEIGTFGPSYVDKIKKFANKLTRWKTFGCDAPTGEKAKFFVRFYVDPSNRAEAEKLLGFKLPDDFCKTKFAKNTTDASPEEKTQIPINIQVDTTGLSEKEKQIIAKKPIINIPKGGYPKVSKDSIDIISRDTLYSAGGAKPLGENSPDTILKLTAVHVPDGYPMVAQKWKHNREGIKHYGLKDGDKVTKIYVHESVAARLKNALNDVVKHYGAENMEELIPSACRFTCSYRTRSDSGRHERGLAIDLNACQNQPYSNSFWKGTKTEKELEELRKKTTFDDPIYAPFLAIMKAHGWENLGQRLRNYGDWMHFEVRG